jgi:hypothetical protein
MDNELKQKWIAALRSGEYKQGHWPTVLNTHDGEKFEHCCLGVLAEVAGVDRDELLDHDHLDKIERQDLLGSWDSGNKDEPPYDREYDVTLTTAQRRLAAMNDNEKSFREIADYIERTL